MARAANTVIWRVLACIAASGFAVSPAAGAERIAMVSLPVEHAVPAWKRMSRGRPDMPARPALSRDGARAHDRYETVNRPRITYRPPRLAKSIRVDLSRLRVTRPVANEARQHPMAWAIPRIVNIGVKSGVMPGAKAVGVEMPVAPYVALESRIGADGEGDMALRFKLRY